MRSCQADTNGRPFRTSATLDNRDPPLCGGEIGSPSAQRRGSWAESGRSNCCLITLYGRFYHPFVIASRRDGGHAGQFPRLATAQSSPSGALLDALHLPTRDRTEGIGLYQPEPTPAQRRTPSVLYVLFNGCVRCAGPQRAGINLRFEALRLPFLSRPYQHVLSPTDYRLGAFPPAGHVSFEAASGLLRPGDF